MINARYKTVAYTFHIDRRVRIPAYETVYNLHDATDRTIANSAKPAANYSCIFHDNGNCSEQAALKLSRAAYRRVKYVHIPIAHHQ